MNLPFSEDHTKPHVLLIYRGKKPGLTMIPSVRLCGHCQMEYLDSAGILEYRAIEAASLSIEDLEWSQIVLLGRLDDWFSCQIARLLRESGRFVVYIIDDDLLNVPEENSNAAHYSQSSVRSNIRNILFLSCAILSPSPLLLEKYAKDSQKKILVEEPAVNPVAYSPLKATKSVKLGFAGSIDRVQDLESILKETLLALKKRYGNRIEICFFGAIPSFARQLNAKCIAYCDDYDEYRRILNNEKWDIGLAPMPDSAFHACKHYNKFSEYAAAGTIGIFSDVLPYTYAKEKFGVGLWCRNDPQIWFQNISRLIDDQPRRERLRQALFDRVLSEISTERSAMVLWEQFKRLQVRECQAIKKMDFLFCKLKFVPRRIAYVIRLYGIRTPLVAWKKMVRRL